MLDCLIVNPSALSQIYQSLSENLTAIEPPIWAGLLANGLRAKGKSVDILDCEGLGLTVGESLAEIIKKEAKVIAIVVYGQQPSASTQNMHAASLLCTAIHENLPYAKTILIGGHVSALPERTLKEEACTFVCKGEGLQTILGILDDQFLDDIAGLGYRTSDGVKINKSADIIPQDKLKDELPGVAWDLLPMDRYRAHNWHAFSNENDRGNYASIYTSLGCPYKCTFCCINAPFGGSSFRFWDVNFTLDQIELLVERYGVKNLKIADEMFVLNKNHYMKLAEGIIERGFDLNIWAYARIDTVKTETLATLKKAGFNWLALGIESGSKFVRDGVKKGRFGGADITEIVKQIQSAGINVIGNYIFGLPDDNFETMQETLDLAIDLNCEMSNFYSAMAYPGSRLYTMALEKGWELPATWLGYSQHSKEALPLRTEYLTSGQVLGFRDYAFDKCFQGTRYLDMVKGKFGPETEDHIRQMTAHKLNRDFAIPYL